MPAAKTPEQKREAVEAKRAEARGEVKQGFNGNIRSALDRPVRKSRQVFNGTQGKLTISQEVVNAFDGAGWHLHTFNDSPGRIETALEGGYEFVTPEEIGSDVATVISRNKSLDDKVKFLVGVGEDGEPLFAYLMKIPKVEFEADQAALQKRNDVVDRQIKSGKNTAQGESSEGFYDAGTKFQN